MSHRVIASLSVVAVVVAVVLCGAVPAMAQTAAPRTAWGQPDLQGVWDFRTITPMQRPEDVPDKEFLTEEEAANLDQEAVAREVRLWEEGARRTEAGGNVGAYNNFWMDRGTRTIGTRRTSLIVDPPGGRYPPMTPEGQRRADARRDDLRDNPSSMDDIVQFGCALRSGLQRGSAHESERLQQQHATVSDGGLRCPHDRDGQHGSRGPARRAFSY